VKGFRR